MHGHTIAGLVVVLASAVAGDEALYRYEGEVLPYPDAGWLWGGCEPPCSESVENGRFVLRWGTVGRLANYTYIISRAQNDPPSLWVEWRFRSNVPIPRFADDCDAFLVVNYRELFDLMFLFGDAIVSFSGDVSLLGLALDEFHTYRFESPNGVNYWFSVDGLVFYASIGDYPDKGFNYLQFGGGGGCGETRPPDPRNEWDYIRYGTIAYGERIVGSDPPDGFVDARTHAPLDRFTVTYDSPNYVYIDEITVNVTAGVPPAVIGTRRLDNGSPDVVEIVLDRPIPYNATTRFTFEDGTAANVVEYTFAPGDTNGDGDADLHDFAAFQNCFEVSPISGACLVFDFNADHSIDLLDFAGFATTLNGK
jgi:hypothetical protein